MDVMKMPADLPDVNLNSNAELVLRKRYQRKMGKSEMAVPRKDRARPVQLWKDGSVTL